MHLFRFLAFILVFCNLPANSQGREVVITYLSWFQPYGTTVGCDRWRQGGAGYLARNLAGVNYPLRSQSAAPSETVSPITFGLSPMGGRFIRSELSDMKAANFDVLAYDMLPHPIPQRPAIGSPGYCGLDLFNRYGEIAEELGMKAAVFSDIKNVSSDYPKGYVFKSEEWAAAYAHIHDVYGGKNWYWRPRGVPALFQFGGSVGALAGYDGVNAIGEWNEISSRLANRGKKIDLFLDIRPGDFKALSGKSNQHAPIPFIFAPGAPYGFMNKFMTQLSEVSPYPVWSVSPGYYNRELKAHLPPDFARIHESYMQAIRQNASVMLVETWNDFEEDTDIVPSANKRSSMTKIFTYYNSWFKSHIQPTVEKSMVVLAVPKVQFDSVRSGPPSWGNGIAEGEGSTPGQIAYYWALMKTSGWLEINGQKILLPVGVSYGRNLIGKTNILQLYTSFDKAEVVNIKAGGHEGEKETTPGRTYNYLMLTE